MFISNAAFAANGCSVYSEYGGNKGKTWFNEYYFGPATDNFLEIFSKNTTVNQNNPSIWNKWYIGIYTSNSTDFYSLSNNTTACTLSGGRTYITNRNPALKLGSIGDAIVVVFDGVPTSASTKEIDAFVFSNDSPPKLYNNTSKFYTPTCAPLKSALDAQVTALGSGSTYSGQNLLVLGSYGTKDLARVPDGVGNWDLTSFSGSGTAYTECVTNDPVDIVKSFTWSPTITTPTSSGTVDPGAIVTFTIAARNATQASMTGVEISDTLPDGLALTGTPTASPGASASCSGAPATCVLTAPATLSANSTAWMSFKAVVSNSTGFAGATIQNTVMQTAGTSLVPAPSADAFITMATGLSLSLAADKSIASPGDLVTFTVTAQNATSYPMTGTIVTIPFSAGFTYHAGYTPTVSSGSINCSATSCTWTLPATLAAGAMPTLTFQATVSGSSGQSLALTATQTAGSTLSVNPYATASVAIAGPSTSSFNACHNFSSSSCFPATGRLLTRLAGTAFTMDIVALKADGTLQTSYVGSGGAAKTVKVDLIDVLNADAVVATQNATFPASDTTGRVTVTWTDIDTAYPHLKVRIAETGGTSPVTSVSSDGFALRPPALLVTTSAAATAELSDSTPVIKAGLPFTVKAVTSPTVGYAATVTVDAGKLATDNVRTGALTLAGAATPLNLQVNANPSNNAAYDEAGYFYAKPGAFRDDLFTAIDLNAPAGCDPAATCDCISSATGDANLSDLLVGTTDRYGCSIGNKATVSFARFIPHHFAMKTTPTFVAGHTACSFTYMDQPFTLSAEIEAQNAAGGKTQNYHGAFANGTVTVQIENSNSGAAIPATRLNRPGTQSWSQGSFSFAADKFTRPASPAAPDGPFDQLAIGISVTDETALPLAQRPLLINRDMDEATTACTADTPGASDGTCPAVSLIPTSGKTTSLRFGRLRLSNAYGSPLLALPVPVQAEYFKTGTGWLVNTQDSCTSIGAGNVALINHAPATFSTSMQANNVTASGALASGKGMIKLPKPAPASAVKSSVTVCVDLGPDTASATTGVPTPACSATASANMPWLQGRWTETQYDDDPFSLATFGVYKSRPVVYMRELY